MNEIKLVPFSHFEKRFKKNKLLVEEYERLSSEFQAIEELIKTRIRKKMTQKQLAEKIGTKQSAIARLESKKVKPNPRLSQLVKIAEALDSRLVIKFEPLDLD